MTATRIERAVDRAGACTGVPTLAPAVSGR